MPKESKEADPSSVKIVLELLDVFPEEFPGLLPERELEFSIDWSPGTTPILKAHYIMVAAKFQQ